MKTMREIRQEEDERVMRGFGGDGSEPDPSPSWAATPRKILAQLDETLALGRAVDADLRSRGAPEEVRRGWESAWPDFLAFYRNTTRSNELGLTDPIRNPLLWGATLDEARRQQRVVLSWRDRIASSRQQLGAGSKMGDAAVPAPGKPAEKKGLSTGAKVGIGIGVGALVAGIGYLLWRRKAENPKTLRGKKVIEARIIRDAERQLALEAAEGRERALAETARRLAEANVTRVV